MSPDAVCPVLAIFREYNYATPFRVAMRGLQFGYAGINAGHRNPPSL